MRGFQEYANWLPEAWKLDVVPLGWTLDHLEHWFAYAFDVVDEINAEERFDIPRRSDRSPTYAPTSRGLVTHAHLIVRHLRLPGSPTEPRVPMDRLGCLAELRHVLEFFRLALTPPKTRSDASHSPAAGDAVDSRPGNSDRKGKQINEKMLAKLTNERDCLAWSIRDWATHLGCSISTVQGTKAWQCVKEARAMSEADKATRQKKNQEPLRKR
jgi:hypothetical protein